MVVAVEAVWDFKRKGATLELDGVQHFSNGVETVDKVKGDRSRVNAHFEVAGWRVTATVKTVWWAVVKDLQCRAGTTTVARHQGGRPIGLSF